MKKQNNILRFLYIVSAYILCNACADDDIYTSTAIKEGIPVEINLSLTIPGMDKITTRALPESEESRVNDLYVLVFDATSGSLKSRKFYPTDDIVSELENKSKGTLPLKTASGESRIYAIANVETNEMSAIRSELDKIDELDDLFNVFCSMNEANIQRVQGSLVMSGAFSQTSAANMVEGYCVIPEHGGTLNGKIQLTRLDSHITFKISTGSQVKSFTPTSWQVKNVPLKSKIIGQNINSFTQASDYGESSVFTGFGTSNESGTNYRTFDFYMLENIKNSKEHEGSSIASNVGNLPDTDKRKEYAKREEEVKNEDKTNTGVYKYSEKYATFVEIKGELEIHQASSIRVATVTYRIHLGGGINAPANFTSKRNTKYTYSITIENVDDIVVEVTEGEENRPGAEGDVIDTESDVRTLDAHYNCFVMSFSYNDVVDSKTGEQGLRFVVKTPFGEVTEKSIPDNNGNASKQDYHWIHFRWNGSGENRTTLLQTYKADEVLDLFGLTNDVIQRYDDDTDISKTKDKLYYYTVFVDEYYYTEAPKGQNWGSDATTYWRHFANADNRYAMLVYAPTHSADGNSSYAKARYMLTQRSIQTYYSTESATALGMEHINETGAADEWGTPGVSDLSSANGLWNTWEYLKKNTSWDSHVTRASWDKTMNTFTTRSGAIALARCLSRNRDENGDGTITLDEVKWYVPSSEQLMGMYLGAKSLPSPLFDADNISFDFDYKENHHYATSDQKRIWSEEGASVGNYATSDANRNPQNFRCVRNLGIDKKTETTVSKENDYPKQAFEYKPKGIRIKVYNQTLQGDEIITADSVFSMSRLTGLNIRGSRIRTGEIAIHHNFEDGNKPYKAFQMAKDFYVPESDRKGGTRVYDSRNKKYFYLTSWDVIIRSYWYDTQGRTNYLTNDNDRSFCKNYSENDDKSDLGLWRAPNQREMMLMYIQNKNCVDGTLARTYWQYEGGERFFCADRNLYLSNPSDKTATFKLRCVRDVEIVK